MANKNIVSVLQEERSFAPSPEFTQRARLEPADVEKLREHAARDHSGFWAEMARNELQWQTPFTITLDTSAAPNYRWFTDGRLNASYNCLDLHLAERGDKTALIFEGEPGDVRRLTYRELHEQVCRFANVLKSQGVNSGDRVIIYMPLMSSRKTSWRIRISCRSCRRSALLRPRLNLPDRPCSSRPM